MGLEVDTDDLRHFYASGRIAGGSVRVVQQRLRHASAAVTVDVYAGLWPSDDESVPHGRGSGDPRPGD
jgi:integrase